MYTSGAKERFPVDASIPTLELGQTEHDTMADVLSRSPHCLYGTLPDIASNRLIFLDYVNNAVVPMLQAVDVSQESPLERLKAGEVSAVVVKGLPTDPYLPASPDNGKDPDDKPSLYSEALALGIASVVGEPSPLVGEKDEALVHQITPIAGYEMTQSNAGQVPLKWHQDLAPLRHMPETPYHRFMPHWLTLVGVNGGSVLSPTYVADIGEALDYVDPKFIATLQQRRFLTNPPASFGGEAGLVTQPPRHAVLVAGPSGVESAFDLGSGTRALDPKDIEATEALHWLELGVESVKKPVYIQPGTALIINNRSVVHARGPIESVSNNPEHRRWLQRVYSFDGYRLVKESIGKPWAIALGGGVVVPVQGQHPGELTDLYVTA